MKKLSVILLITIFCGTMGYAQKHAKTPLDLLKTIHKLAKEKKYKKLNKYLYQGKITNAPIKEMANKTMGQLILEGIQGKKTIGVAAYNAQGLNAIITKHAERIAPISKKLIDELFGEENDGFAQFADLKYLADNRPNDLYIFDHKGVHILMAKLKKKRFVLVIWEGLSNIIEDNKNSTEPKVVNGGK
ncbi:hypothetical protein [uncultured Microscilla sp.]|uniref:hypothetical protein n=1 Tax=uncultured Microscilla sp. TaxID=432653 RepID=UPI002626C6E1|nr:hypothetical protein [uncultured Microscilla sp.]